MLSEDSRVAGIKVSGTVFCPRNYRKRFLTPLIHPKGLEFPEVYLVGMEEEILPHHRSIKADGTAIDEERRLCYVGVTRAQDRLTMSLALSRRKWGKPRDSFPSRFLFELTGQAENPHQAVQLARQRSGKKKSPAPRQ